MMKCRLALRSTRNSILPPLMSDDRLGDVRGDRAGLRVGHQAARAEDPAEAADLAHQVRRRDDGVEVEAALVDLVDQGVVADDVGAGGLGLLGTLTGGEDQDPGGLAGAVRQVDGAADHLVGLARVDAQAHGDLDGRRRTSWSTSPWPAGRPAGGRRGRRRRSSRRRRGRTCCASLLLLVRDRSLRESWYDGPRSALPRRAGGAGSATVALDGDAHLAGGAGDDLLGGVEVVGVEVGHLGLGDGPDLGAGQAGDLGLVRLAGALLDAGGGQDQPGGRRRLGDEGERRGPRRPRSPPARPGRAATRSAAL